MTLTLAALLLLSISAFAAEEPKASEYNLKDGDWFLGAQTNILAFAHPAIDTAVYGGYFVSGGFEIGPVLTLMYNSSANDTDYTTSYSDGSDDLDRTETETDTYSFYGLGVQVGYFFESKSFAVPYGMLMLEYGAYSSNEKDETEYKPENADSVTETTTDKSDGSGFRITPKFGAMFFLTKNFAIDGAVFARYASMTGTTTEEYKSDSFPDEEYKDEGDSNTVTTDFGFAVGMNFFFK